PGLLTALLLRVGSLAVVMPADHPFATQRSVAWSSVADAHWVEAPALMPHLGPGAADLLQRRKARARYEGSDPSVLGSLVAAGHGLALVPSSWNAGSSGAVAVALSEPALVHRVEMMVLRQRADEWNRLVSLVRSS
ncbi:MAG: LysR family transcriptional regulator, partial [Ilumatobacteraceae bacterium]|nr:LysR family transcriptional regulator [Ilumatobacteraceae bacterium]